MENHTSIRNSLALLLVVSTLALTSGCSTIPKIPNPFKVEKPDTSVPAPIVYKEFSDVKPAEFKPLPVYPLTEYPTATLIKQSGKEYAAFDSDGLLKLFELRIQHQHNTDQLNKANELLELSVKERNEIHGIGIALQEKVNLQAEKTALRERELKAEKRENFMQRFVERAFFVGALILALH